MRNHCYENEFYLQVHFHANQTYFQKKGFALRLVLKQGRKVTRKWPIFFSNNSARACNEFWAGNIILKKLNYIRVYNIGQSVLLL